MGRIFPPLAAAALVFAAAAAPASAATVEVRERSNDTVVHYAAAPGERNDAAFSHVDNHTVRVTDAGATIEAGRGCRSIDAQTAECEYREPARPGRPYLSFAVVVARDGDDVIRSLGAREQGAGGPGLIANGGPGDDELEGSTGKRDELDGGGGRDRLLARGNSDLLTDGDTPGDVNADHLDGGADGRDMVSYASRSAAVTVDIAEGHAGDPGEGDVIVGMEGAIGGSGDDVLRGSGATNWLIGGDGDDTLVGRARRDDLEGGAGNDRIRGGRGWDRIEPGTGRNRVDGGSGNENVFLAGGRSHVECGSGPRDSVFSARPADFIGRGCERVVYVFGGSGEDFPEDTQMMQFAPYPTAVRTRSLTFALTCPYSSNVGGGCRPARGELRVTDTRTGGLLGRAEFVTSLVRSQRQQWRTVRVRLTALGRRVVSRRGATRATVSVRGEGVPEAGWTIRLPRRAAGTAEPLFTG